MIAAGLLAYRAGRVGPGFWALVSGGGAIFVGAVHFGPAAVEPPQLILGHYGLPILGWLAFGWLVTFVAVLAITLGLATARDGTAVHLRLLRRDERELVARFFAGLSEESRRRRYLKPMARLSAAMLRRLVEVDGRRRVAVVAEVDGQCVGIASWIALADEPGPAEGRGRCHRPLPGLGHRAAAGGGPVAAGRPRWPDLPGLPGGPDQPIGAAAAVVARRRAGLL